MQVPGEPGWRVVKLLSVDPTNYEDAPREGIRRILEEVLLFLLLWGFWNGLSFLQLAASLVN
jgi:hypothetical protein